MLQLRARSPVRRACSSLADSSGSFGWQWFHLFSQFQLLGPGWWSETLSTSPSSPQRLLKCFVLNSLFGIARLYSCLPSWIRVMSILIRQRICKSVLLPSVNAYDLWINTFWRRSDEFFKSEDALSPASQALKGKSLDSTTIAAAAKVLEQELKAGTEGIEGIGIFKTGRRDLNVKRLFFFKSDHAFIYLLFWNSFLGQTSIPVCRRYFWKGFEAQTTSYEKSDVHGQIGLVFRELWDVYTLCILV